MLKNVYRWADLSLRRKVLAVAAVPFVPLILVTLLVFAGARRERDATAWVEHTLAVKAEIATVFGLLADAETGARGYALSPHPDTLAVVRAAMARLPAHYNQLLQMLADSPDQQQRVRRVMALDEQRPVEELLRYGSDSDQGSPEPLLARSRTAMRDIREELALMQLEADQLLASRVATARQARREAQLVTLGGLIVGVIASLSAIVAFTGSLSRRLNRLRENANLLAHSREMLPAVAAADEIGEVSAALEQTAALLRARDAQIAQQLAALQETRGELMQFFDVSLDMLCIAGIDGRFRKVNRAWQAVLGWSSEELVSRPFLDFVHPDDIAITETHARSLASGVQTVDFENRYRCRDGTYKWLNWKAAPDSGRGLIYAVARDVTVSRVAEEQIRQAQAQAERANQAKSEFVSRMSHDMRTPLNSVLGFAQVLETEPLTPAQQESVQLISRGGRHLLDLINEVLDIARIEAGQLSLSPEPVDLGEVVSHAVQLIAPLAATRQVRIDLETPERTYIVDADRQRLNQLLLNLLSNAVKYNRRGGHVDINFAEVSHGGRVRLRVTDTGLGIPAEKLSRLFVPFERLGAEATGVEGTGLGLAVSRGLALAMGGELGVSSEVGRGSTFWLELTVSTKASRDGGAERAEAATLDRNVNGRVLYIEDNPANVRLMQRIFERRPGVTLHSAPSARAGLELALALKPQAIFLDLHLPDLHGSDVLRELRSDPQLADIPVAVLSADATPAQIRSLLAAGATAYLTKPLDVTKVLATLDELVMRASTPPSAIRAGDSGHV